MAGAGGTGKPKQPTIDDLREMLIPELIKHLSGPEPTPPQYQPAPISPMQGYAIARNPQAAGLINQTIQAPGQAQFQQQQAAFEQAMGQRKEALGAAISLSGQQARVRPGVSWQQRLVDGKPHTIQVITDPQSGMPVNEIDFGEKFVPPAISPYLDPNTGAANLGRVSRTTGEVAPVTSSGRQVGAIPPPGTVQDFTTAQTTAQQIGDIKSAWRKIHDYTAGTPGGLAGQYVATKIGETRIGGAVAPEYAAYTTARRVALNNYVKQQTGAQFSEAEMSRYESQFPEPWDSEELADQKIAALQLRAVNDMRTKQRLYPSLGGGSTAAPANETPEQKKARIKAKYGLR